VWGAADSPVAAFVATIAFGNPFVVEVFVVDSWMSTDGSGSPALASEGETDSPAETASRLELLYHWVRWACTLYLTCCWA
jgi:hypothetical protein